MSIKAEHINYIYGQGTAFEQYALKDVSFEIKDGQFIGLIGHTGSGKSTLIQHLNGLLKASSGVIYYNEENIYGEGYDMKALRSKVGLVFQYPEHQLFEVDVFSDVCFGRAFYKEAPILILDEPTAGLDPKGREEILDEISELHQKQSMTIILVSHSMEDVARYADRIMVMSNGEKVFDAPPKEVFRHYRELEQIGLAAPQTTYIIQRLREHGVPIADDITTVSEAKTAILDLLGR